MIANNVSWSNWALVRSSPTSCHSVSSSQSSAGCRFHCTPRRFALKIARSSAVSSVAARITLRVIPSGPSIPTFTPRLRCAASSAGFAPSGSSRACHTSACTRSRSGEVLRALSTSAASATSSSSAAARRAMEPSASTITRAASTLIVPCRERGADMRPPAGQLLALHRQPRPNPKPERCPLPRFASADQQLPGQEIGCVPVTGSSGEAVLAELLPRPPGDLTRRARPGARRRAGPAPPRPRSPRAAAGHPSPPDRTATRRRR